MPILVTFGNKISLVKLCTWEEKEKEPVAHLTFKTCHSNTTIVYYGSLKIVKTLFKVLIIFVFFSPKNVLKLVKLPFEFSLTNSTIE